MSAIARRSPTKRGRKGPATSELLSGDDGSSAAAPRATVSSATMATKAGGRMLFWITSVPPFVRDSGAELQLVEDRRPSASLDDAQDDGGALGGNEDGPRELEGPLLGDRQRAGHEEHGLAIPEGRAHRLTGSVEVELEAHGRGRVPGDDGVKLQLSGVLVDEEHVFQLDDLGATGREVDAEIALVPRGSVDRVALDRGPVAGELRAVDLVVAVGAAAPGADAAGDDEERGAACGDEERWAADAHDLRQSRRHAMPGSASKWQDHPQGYARRRDRLDREGRARGAGDPKGASSEPQVHDRHRPVSSGVPRRRGRSVLRGGRG